MSAAVVRSLQKILPTVTWATDAKPIEAEQDREEARKQRRLLQDSLRNFESAKRPCAPTVERVTGLLAALREKLEAASQPGVLGRYSKREAEVAEARVENAVVQIANENVQNRQEKLMANITRDIEELKKQQKCAEELNARNANAFNLMAKATNDAMKGKRDESMDELTEKLTTIAALMKPEGCDELFDTKATWQGKPVVLIGMAVSEGAMPNYCFRLVGGGDGDDRSEEVYQCPKEELVMPALEEQRPAKRPRTKASGSSGGDETALQEERASGAGRDTVDARPRCGAMTKANRPCKRRVKNAGDRCPNHTAEEDPATAEMEAEEEKAERMVAEQKALEERSWEQEEKTAKLEVARPEWKLRSASWRAGTLSCGASSRLIKRGDSHVVHELVSSCSDTVAEQKALEERSREQEEKTAKLEVARPERKLRSASWRTGTLSCGAASRLIKRGGSHVAHVLASSCSDTELEPTGASVPAPPCLSFG